MKSTYLNNQFFNHIFFNQVTRYMPETWSGETHSSPWQAAYQGQTDVPLCVDVGREVCCLKSHFSCRLIWWPTCAGFLHTAWMSMVSDQELHTLTVKLHQRAHTAYTTRQTRLSSLNKGTCYIKHIWSDSQSSKPGSKLDMFDRASQILVIVWKKDDNIMTYILHILASKPALSKLNKACWNTSLTSL